MKKFLPLFLVFFVSLTALGSLTAQTAADLTGINWKNRQTGLDALSFTQSDVAVTAPLATADFGQINLKFREVAFNNVRDLIENSHDFSFSILKGYESAIVFMQGEPLFENINKQDRKKTFDELVNVLKI